MVSSLGLWQKLTSFPSYSHAFSLSFSYENVDEKFSRSSAFLESNMGVATILESPSNRVVSTIVYIVLNYTVLFNSS